MAQPEFVYEIYIRAPIDTVWRALTEAEFTAQYFYATHVESDWKQGSPIYFRNAPGGEVAVSGEVVRCEPPTCLEISWLIHYDADKNAEGASRVCFELEARADQTRLRVSHDGFGVNSVVYPSIREGWPWILSSLKSLLETSEPLAAA